VLITQKSLHLIFDSNALDFCKNIHIRMRSYYNHYCRFNHDIRFNSRRAF